MKKIIQEKTIYISAFQLREVEMTDTHQIRCKFQSNDIDDKLWWNGKIEKIHLDKNGEAIGYNVYVY